MVDCEAFEVTYRSCDGVLHQQIKGLWKCRNSERTQRYYGERELLKGRPRWTNRLLRLRGTLPSLHQSQGPELAI
jgi:hypothetical protein